MLDGNFNPLKAFVSEEIYLGKLSKVFWDAQREKKIGLSLKTDEKNKNWREKKNCAQRHAAAAATSSTSE